MTTELEENVGRLVEYIAGTLSRRPEAVRVEAFLEDRDLEVNLVVDQVDMGRVIGRQGRVAHAIRALAKATHADPRLHVILNIDSWQELNGEDYSPDSTESEPPESEPSEEE